MQQEIVSSKFSVQR